MEKTQFLALTSVSFLFSLQLWYEKSHLAEKAQNLLAAKSKAFSMGKFTTFTKVSFELVRTKMVTPIINSD